MILFSGAHLSEIWTYIRKVFGRNPASLNRSLVKGQQLVDAVAVVQDHRHVVAERTDFRGSTVDLKKLVNQGSMLWFFNIFAEKNQRKMAFLTQNKAKLCKILIITLVFEKNANFFAENCRKSQKIVIITSTPGLRVTRRVSEKIANYVHSPTHFWANLNFKWKK
jgi:hypothetical protein